MNDINVSTRTVDMDVSVVDSQPINIVSEQSNKDINIVTKQENISVTMEPLAQPIVIAINNAGADGARGPQGDPGIGVIPGGAMNDVLMKNSGTNYDTKWKTLDKTDVGLNNVPNVDATNASNITSGTLSGDILPAMSSNKLGGVPATGVPSGKFLKDDGTWGAGGGPGTTDHAALSNLAYNVSGHTGFAPATFQERTNVEDLFKDAYNTAYAEFTYNTGDLSQIDIWNNSGKGTKLFTKVINYSLGNISTINITDNITSNTLLKAFSYDIDGNISSITKTYT